jgi:hypothetical protein
MVCVKRKVAARHGTDLNPGSTSIVGSADGHCDHHLPYVRTTMASM